MVGQASPQSPQWPLPEGEDTRLARELHARGWVDVGILQVCLEEVRRARGRGLQAPLAGILLERRLVDAQTLSQLGARPLAPRAASPAAPPQLGSYRLGRELGRGGMGAVFEAQHVVTGQRYALKLMDLGGFEDGGESLERFRREARLGSRLEHPAVVAVLDADLEGPTPWIVQELLPGETLLDHLRQTGPLGWAEALELLTPIADALGHAHERGVLHRDLKPSNILLDAEGRARLADFGLARESGGQLLRLTVSGEAIGTPNYMAPEQATGARVQGPTLDVYGFCAVLYQVLTGRPPFAGATILETLQQIVQEPAPRLSASLEVPPQLDALVASGLEKSPGDRPVDGAVLAAELRACAQAGETGEPPRPSGILGVVAAGALALGIGLVAVVGLGREAAPTAASPAASPLGLATPTPAQDSAPPLSAAEVGAPADWGLAWSLEEGARVQRPLLWADPGRVADPLAALEREGGAEALFSGAAEPAGPGRWRVRYTPRRGLRRLVSRLPGSLVRPLPARGGQAQPAAYSWLEGPGASGDQAWIGCPNDGGQLVVVAGRGRWEDARVSARLAVEPIDRGSVLLWDGSDYPVRYVGRARQLNRRQAVARLNWSSLATLSVDQSAAQGRLRFEDQVFDELSPPLEPGQARSLYAPKLGLNEGWFLVDSLVVEGRPLKGDRAALAEAAPGRTHFAFGLRFRCEPGPGGPCLDLGEGPQRLRLSASSEGLRLRLGERILRRVPLPLGAEEGVLSLLRRGDVLEGRLVTESETWSLSCVVPDPLRGPLRYGSTGPRLEVLSAALWAGPPDPERQAHDLGTQPDPLSALGEWRRACLEFESLFDPLRLDPALRTPAGTSTRVAAWTGLAERLGRVAQRLPQVQRRDALARGLLAAAYAGQGSAAGALGEALAAEGPAEGREVLAWLGGGGLADSMKSGLVIATQAPPIARAGALGIRPLVSEGERAQVDWTLLHAGRLEAETLSRSRRLSGEELAGVATLAEGLESVRARGYAGPLGREVGLDLAWCYLTLGKRELYCARLEEVLGTPSGSQYSYAWLGYARSLVAWGELQRAGECLIAALARGAGNATIRVGVERLVAQGGTRWPPAPLAAVAWIMSGVASRDAGRWEQLARNAATTALGRERAPRARDLAAFVLLRLGTEVPPSYQGGAGAMGRLLGWYRGGVLPSAPELRSAIAEDRLVEHLALLDPRYSGLLED